MVLPRITEFDKVIQVGKSMFLEFSHAANPRGGAPASTKFL